VAGAGLIRRRAVAEKKNGSGVVPAVAVRNDVRSLSQPWSLMNALEFVFDP
jgi:hypothetical protein